MISRSTGEATFFDLKVAPQKVVPSPVGCRFRDLSAKDWRWHRLGIYRADHGKFEVEALTDKDDRVQILLLAHSHPSYKPNTPGDSERRAFHEGVISTDLAGQHEFSWGEVLCRLNATENKDWLVIAYTRGPHVPGQTPEVLLRLYAREPEPYDD